MRAAGAAIAGAVLAAGMLAASPMLAGPASAVTATTTVSSARQGHERLYISGRPATARKDYLRASGVLKARGYALPGALTGGRGTIWLVFRRGSIRLAIAVRSSSATVPNPQTCAFTEVYRGTYAVRGGHRSYARASGSGTFYTRISGRLAMSGGSCTARLAWSRKYTWTSGSLAW
jgi:hypothetical protein